MTVCQKLLNLETTCVHDRHYKLFSWTTVTVENCPLKDIQRIGLNALSWYDVTLDGL